MITLFGRVLRLWPISTPDRFAMMEIRYSAEHVHGKDWLEHYLTAVWTMREPVTPKSQAKWPIETDVSGKVDVARLPQKLKIAAR